MSVRRHAKKVAKNYVVNWIASIPYIAGLTLLIPLKLYITIPSALYTGAFIATLLAALALIAIAFSILFWYTKSRKDALNHLGWVTFIPAVIAFVLNWYSIDVLFMTANAIGPDVEFFRPLVDAYIATHVPQAELFVYGYFVIGLFLLFVSYKLRR